MKPRKSSAMPQNHVVRLIINWVFLLVLAASMTTQVLHDINTNEVLRRPSTVLLYGGLFLVFVSYWFISSIFAIIAWIIWFHKRKLSDESETAFSTSFKALFTKWPAFKR